MKLAYLLNTFPLTSTTFIRREIAALERAGQRVHRYALRRWDGELVDPADLEDQSRTHYILSGNGKGLVLAFLKALATNPGGLMRAIGPWWSLWRSARGGLIRHIAYFLEAIYFHQTAARDEIDHVHVHFLTNAAAVAMLARIMGGPSYSVMVHGPDELVDAPLLDFPAKIQHAAFITAISHFCKSQIVRFSSIANSEKIHIVHCGLQLDEFNPNFEMSDGNHQLVCVGRLCPQKGQVQIPRAIAQLVEKHPNLRVKLIGDGESRVEVEAEINRAGLQDKIEITGWMSNVEVRQEIAAARALLLPSYAEGLPVVIMEAMALGRPVISTYIAGIPELLDQDCGWIIPAGSEDALVDALDAVITASPQGLEKMGREGRRRVEERHDVDREAKTLLSHVKAVVAERAS